MLNKSPTCIIIDCSHGAALMSFDSPGPSCPQVKDAESYADEDKKRREAVDTKNQAESQIYQTEKQLKEFEDK